MRDRIKPFFVGLLWIAYISLTVLVGYDLYLGDPFGLLKNYVFGTAGLWAAAGVFLWYFTTEE